MIEISELFCLHVLWSGNVFCGVGSTSMRRKTRKRHWRGRRYRKKVQSFILNLSIFLSLFIHSFSRSFWNLCISCLVLEIFIRKSEQLQIVVCDFVRASLLPSFLLHFPLFPTYVSISFDFVIMCWNPTFASPEQFNRFAMKQNRCLLSPWCSEILPQPFPNGPYLFGRKQCHKSTPNLPQF